MKDIHTHTKQNNVVGNPLGIFCPVLFLPRACGLAAREHSKTLQDKLCEGTEEQAASKAGNRKC